MMRSATTTTTRPRERPRSAPALPAALPSYDELRARALALASAEGWRVCVEPPGGPLVTLAGGPGPYHRDAAPAGHRRTLVLSLGPGPGPLDLAELYPQPERTSR